jgi:hypothetical protein
MTSEATVPEAAVRAIASVINPQALRPRLPGHERGHCAQCDGEEEAALETGRAALTAALPHLSTAIRDAALSVEDEALCMERGMEQWEKSLRRPDLDERARVGGAIAAALRQALAISLLPNPAPAKGNEAEAAAPAQAPGELDWRDMATAPKDGTHLLVKLPGETTPPTVAHWFQPVPGDGEGGWYLSVQQIAGPAIEPIGWLPIAALSQEQRGAVEVSDAQIKYMVDRFLNWPIPAEFDPDAGISFEPIANLGTPYEYRREPVGTNLFDASQAEAMVRHMVEGLALAATPVHQEAGE